MIDGYPVLAELINEELSEIIVTKSEEWKTKCVRESQYFLKIVKCTDEACCSLFQSSYLVIMKDQFLPPPVPVVYSQNGVTEWAKDDKEASSLFLFQNIPCLMPKHAITTSKGNSIRIFLPFNKGYSCRPYLRNLRSLFGKYQVMAIPLSILLSKGFASSCQKNRDEKSMTATSHRLYLIWIQSGQVIDQLLSKPKKGLT